MGEKLMVWRKINVCLIVLNFESSNYVCIWFFSKWYEVEDNLLVILKRMIVWL